MDRRTKRQKLQAMANQGVSPEEAKIAQEKLKDLPPDPPMIRSVFRIIINGHEIHIGEYGEVFTIFTRGE